MFLGHGKSEGCICALIKPVATSTRVLIVMHDDEVKKPTNTGRLASLVLERSAIHVVGDGPRAPVTFGDDEKPLLLFPSKDALALKDVVAAAAGVPRTLVVPDGTWRQARKMPARVVGLAGIPCCILDDDAPTEYRLRNERRTGGLATLEAIARALRILEGPRGAAVEEALLVPFRAMVARTLATRGLA